MTLKSYSRSTDGFVHRCGICWKRILIWSALTLFQPKPYQECTCRTAQVYRKRECNFLQEKMLRIIIVDKQLRMLRPNESFPTFSYYQLLCMLSKAVITNLCSLKNNDFLSVYDKDVSKSKGGLLNTFSSDASNLCSEIDQSQQNTKVLHTTEVTAALIGNILMEAYAYYGPWSNIQILLFTDGGSSHFTLSSFTWPENFPESLYSTVSILFISLSDKKLSNDLLEVYNKFHLKSAILEGSKYISNPKEYTVQGYVDNLAEHVVNKCHEMYPDSQNVVINCGRLQSSATLISSPGIHFTTESDNMIIDSLYMEIFGFLNLSDLNNPPVNGRFIVVSKQQSTVDEPDFLCLLLEALKTTKSAAVCNIYVIMTNITQESDPSYSSERHNHKYHHHHHQSQHRSENQKQEHIKNSLNRTFWTHGYLHHIDLKKSILVLSVFEKDCTGLPWLGQFSHLAPVTDFAGSQLYDDVNGTSPFPVRTPDYLSYKTDSTRYVSWSSQSAMLMDINKVFRLSRRLPDKSALLYKELNRLRSAATLYGCPDLLLKIHSMIMSMHESSITQHSNINNDHIKALQDCLNHVSRLLLQQEVDSHGDNEADGDASNKRMITVSSSDKS
ncbi:unnamed protein product [Trichobilharzia szidati]|nr:unnamed protein product [Trichobilharzia szidati]